MLPRHFGTPPRLSLRGSASSVFAPRETKAVQHPSRGDCFGTIASKREKRSRSDFASGVKKESKSGLAHITAGNGNKAEKVHQNRMKVIKKKNKANVSERLSHGLYYGRVVGEDKDNRSNEVRVNVEIPAHGRTLPMEIEGEYDEQAESGQRIAALLGGEIPEEIPIQGLIGKEAFFVVVVNKTAGGNPRDQIATVLSIASVRAALNQMEEQKARGTETGN